MLNVEQMKLLKQVNVSKDTEKTQTRVREDFSSASASQKSRVAEAAGQALNTFYRIYKTGNAHAKQILALAHELNISPFYYTGEIDKKEACTDKLVKQFLVELGYDMLADELEKQTAKPKRKYTRKPKDEPAADNPVEDAACETCAKHTTSEAYIAEDENAVSEDIIVYELEFSDEPCMQKAMEELDEDMTQILLKSLFIRAKAGGQAAVYADVIKRCLLQS